VIATFGLGVVYDSLKFPQFCIYKLVYNQFWLNIEGLVARCGFFFQILKNLFYIDGFCILQMLDFWTPNLGGALEKEKYKSYIILKLDDIAKKLVMQNLKVLVLQLCSK
jgi:hypothetical protein